MAHHLLLDSLDDTPPTGADLFFAAQAHPYLASLLSAERAVLDADEAYRTSPTPEAWGASLVAAEALHVARRAWYAADCPTVGVDPWLDIDTEAVGFLMGDKPPVTGAHK